MTRHMSALAQIARWMAIVAASFAAHLWAQVPPPGITVLDRTTLTPLSTPVLPDVELQVQPILVAVNAEPNAILRSNGIEGNASTVEALKRLNPGAFDGNRLRFGSQLYVPAPKYADSKAFHQYAIRFDEPDLGRVQLQSDALSMRRLAVRMEAVNDGAAGKLVLRDQASLLKKMASDFDILSKRHSAQLGGSELSTVSFYRELAEHLSTTSLAPDGPKRIQNLHLLKEVTDALNIVTEGAGALGSSKRIGKRVIIHYAYLPSKKPMHGRQLFALPRGMQALPSNFTREMIARALAMHRFDGITSPSSKMLPWGHFVVIAGPQQVTDDLVTKVMENQKALDMTGISITTSSTWEELELFLPVRNP